MKKKVVVVFNSLEIGGIERKIVDIVNFLQTNYQVTLILRYKQGQLLSQISPKISVIESSLYPPLLTLKLLSINPKLILTFGNYCAICTVLSAPFSRIIISEDSSFDKQINLDSFPQLRRVLVKITYPIASKIIALSVAGKDKLGKIVSSKKIVLLPNWLPLSFKPSKRKNKTIDIVYMGRFVSQKNPLLFLKFCRQLIIRIPHLTVVMYGQGPLESYIKKYIQKNNLSKNITVFPANPNIQNIYQQSKLLLLTSVHEGFPLTVLEASANHCLPIVKKLPELTNFFDFYPSNIIYKQNPVNKITKLLENPKLLSKIASYYQNKALTEQLINFHQTVDYITHNI